MHSPGSRVPAPGGLCGLAGRLAADTDCASAPRKERRQGHGAGAVSQGLKTTRSVHVQDRDASPSSEASERMAHQRGRLDPRAHSDQEGGCL